MHWSASHSNTGKVIDIPPLAMQKVSVIHLKHTASNQQGRGWDPAPPALSRILYDSSSSFSKTGLSQKACMPDYSHAIPPRKSEKAAYGSPRVAALSSEEGRWRETSRQVRKCQPCSHRTRYGGLYPSTHSYSKCWLRYYHWTHAASFFTLKCLKHKERDIEESKQEGEKDSSHGYLAVPTMEVAQVGEMAWETAEYPASSDSFSASVLP